MSKPEDYYDLGGKTLEEWDAEHQYWELPPLSAFGLEQEAEKECKAKEKARAEQLKNSRFDGMRHKAQVHLPDLIERDGKYCQRCGTTEQLSIDHVVPLVRGGTNDFDNLQLLCNKCNSAKGARE